MTSARWGPYLVGVVHILHDEGTDSSIRVFHHDSHRCVVVTEAACTGVEQQCCIHCVEMHLVVPLGDIPQACRPAP